MKVCTDACLFGAVVTNRLETEKVSRILDIGAGTGLLSLMLAQKIDAMIDAVEIDAAASQQAIQNFEQSPWKERLKILNTDILTFAADKKYDFIISNPPFFEGDLKSSHNNKNAAKHDTALTLQQLILAVTTHLESNGIFAVLLPFHRVNQSMEIAAVNGLVLIEKILVKQSPHHAYFRSILFFSRKSVATTFREIIIKDETGNYAPVFTDLLKDYYLNL